MLKNTASSGWRRRRQQIFGAVWLLLLCCMTGAPLQAQDWMSGVSPWSTFTNPMTQSTSSPWSSFGSPMSPSTLSPWSSFGSPMPPSTFQSQPNSYGSQSSGLSGFSDPYSPYSPQQYGAWQTPHGGSPPACSGTATNGSHQPDLTGFWRGSGGESVEVQRNYARIWGGTDKPCNCIFFLVGQRLIAYSPDTDVVRKYWYQSGGSNQFTLVDESGNLMTYQRSR